MAHEKLVKEGEEAIRKGIKPAEVQDYFLKKGMDSKEAKDETTKLQASRIVEEAKKAEAAKRSAPTARNNSAAPGKKSSFGFWFIILLLIAVIIYFFYRGYLSLDMFKIFNMMK